jgi:O-antigen ligase
MGAMSYVRAVAPFCWPGGAFLATALVGVWAAYDRDIAWRRWELIALGIVLAIGIIGTVAWTGRRALGAIGVGCGLLGAAIGSYFLLASDWMQSEPTKLATVHQAGLWLYAHRPAHLSEGIHGNSAGGALAIAIPLGLAGLGWASARRYHTIAVVSALAVLVACVALVLTASRGAWIGLAVGALAAGYLGWRADRYSESPTSRLRPVAWPDGVVVGATLLVVCGGFWAVITLPSVGDLVRHLSGGADESAVSRLDLWQRLPALIRDYAFTGGGLGATEMLYSSYVLLVHVPYFSHAHNLFLQIAVEQGAPGLVAFLWLSVTGVSAVMRASLGRVQDRWFECAALASMVTLLVHGLVDAELYASTLAPLTFVPIGFALACAQERPASAQSDTPSWAALRDRRAAVSWCLTPVLIAALALLLPGSRAALHANFGAVAQSRAELSVYGWPAWPVQDAVRRSPAVDLSPAIASYRAALALDPTNETANRRLGQIELSIGQYQAARHHLEEAHSVAPHQRETLQLWGESYAVGGDVDAAAVLWRSLDVDQGQLDVRQHFYEQLGETQRASWMRQASALSRSLARSTETP